MVLVTDIAAREDVRRRVNHLLHQVERWLFRSYANNEKYEMDRIQSILHNLHSFLEYSLYAVAG